MNSIDKNINKRIILGLLNLVCDTEFDDFTEIVENIGGVTYSFMCVKDGEKTEKIISKEYFDECVEVMNEELAIRK